ncbi:MAG: hypothetical protein ACRDPD_27745, partial [Streptosporangiaceae bacterium]
MSELTSRAEPATPTAPETCRWEYGQQCTRPPAPRRKPTGPAPVYCEQGDAPGQPVHNPLNAWRAKTRPAGPTDDPQAERTPVATAIKTASGALDRAEQLAAALRETAEHLAEALATAGNPDAAAAQIDAQLADAREEAARQGAAADRETAARLTAEARAEEARQMAEEMAGQAEAAQGDAEDARADASSARAELRNRMIEHEETRQAIQQEAGRVIAEAREQAEVSIRQARAEAGEAIARAEADKAAGIAEAQARADLAAARAADLVRAAETGRDQARADAEQAGQ